MISNRSLRMFELSEVLHQGKAGRPVGAWVVFGGQAGSEGKGAICGYLAQRVEFAASISNFMPNAGHTWVADDGRKIVVHHLPTAAVSERATRLWLGAGSVIDPAQLLKEAEQIEETMGIRVFDRVGIHPRAMVVDEEHREWEREHLQYISSTCRGSAAANADKSRRVPGVILARDHPDLRGFIRKDMDEAMQRLLNVGKGVLVEGSQGFELDINRGYAYPQCTSRQCTPAQLLADAAIEGRMLTRSIAVIRTYPIRVGHAFDGDGNKIGDSGGWGAKEISFGALGQKGEHTTTTGKPRRVFEQDWKAVERMSAICRPTEVALTFADYLDPSIAGLTNDRYRADHGANLWTVSPETARFVDRIERTMSRATTNPRVCMIKTGPRDSEALDWL